MDDLRWADRSSLLTLAAFSRCLAYVPVALVGCLRPVPRLAELERLAGALQSAGARQLALTPLAAGARITEHSTYTGGLLGPTIATGAGLGLLFMP